MSFNDWTSIISQLPRMSIVSLTGGEPLLHPDFFRIFKSAAAARPLSIETNGTLIGSDTAERLVEKAFKPFKAAGLGAVSISIHGTEEIHNRIVKSDNAFQRAADGVRKLIEARGGGKFPRVSIRSVILPENAEILGRMPAVARGLGADELVFSHESSSESVMDFGKGITVHSSGSSPEPIDASTLENALKQAFDKPGIPVSINPRCSISDTVSIYGGGKKTEGFDCLFPWTKVIISQYGDIGICPMGWIGNIRDNNLIDVINNRQARDFRKQLLESKELPPGCAGCCGKVSLRRY